MVLHHTDKGYMQYKPNTDMYEIDMTAAKTKIENIYWTWIISIIMTMLNVIDIYIDNALAKTTIHIEKQCWINWHTQSIYINV